MHYNSCPRTSTAAVVLIHLISISVLNLLIGRDGVGTVLKNRKKLKNDKTMDTAWLTQVTKARCCPQNILSIATNHLTFV